MSAGEQVQEQVMRDGTEIEVSVGRRNEWIFGAGGVSVRVTEPCPKPTNTNYYSRVYEWQPTQEPQYSSIDIQGYHYSNFNPLEAEQSAMAMMVAAEACRARNLAVADVLASQDQRHKEHETREQREKEEKERAKNELKDLLQNYVGQTFKLKRDGYRATVYGTVDRFDERRLWSTSERGVPMTTDIASISFFAVKWDGEKRYETVYDRAAVVAAS